MSDINLQLLTLPDDSPLATASWEERRKALNLNSDGTPKAEPRKWLDAVRPNRIIISSLNPVKVDATKAAFRDMVSFGFDVVFTSMVGLSGVSDQPKSSAETRQGAENRARGVFEAYTDTLYSVGIEGGIEDGPDGMTSFAWVCVFDGKKTSFAQTGVFYLPDEVASLVREGKELGEADDIVFSRSNSKQFEGAIGLLTHNSITRMEYYTQAIVMALIPFENKSLTWPSPALEIPTVEPYLDAQAVAVAEVQAVKDREFAVGTTAMHMDEPVLVLSSSANHLERYVFFLEDAVRGREWVRTKDLHLSEDMSLEDALDTLISLIEIGDDALATSQQANGVLRQKNASLESDIKLQSGMIEAKNQDSVRLFNELQQAKARVTQLEAQLLEQASAAPMPEPKKRTEYMSLMADMTTPSERKAADAELQKLKNSGEGWKIEHIDMMSHEAGFSRYILLKRKTADLPQPEPQKEAKAEASRPAVTPVPEPVPTPVIDHSIVLTSTPEPVLNRFPIGQAIKTHGAQAVKLAMNQQAIAAGAIAAAARMAELTERPDPLDTPLLSGHLTDLIVR